MPKNDNIESEGTNASAGTKKAGLGAGAIAAIAVGGVAVIAAAGLGGAAIAQTIAHNERPPFSHQQDANGGQFGGDGDRDGGHMDGRHPMGDGQDQGGWTPQGGQMGQGGTGQMTPPQAPNGTQSTVPQSTQPQGMAPMPQGGFTGGMQGPGGANGFTGGS